STTLLTTYSEWLSVWLPVPVIRIMIHSLRNSPLLLHVITLIHCLIVWQCLFMRCFRSFWFVNAIR
ncbi:hypothetical protein COCVIDRAFT_116033, partial [Bipolaris victoriae FI3]